MFLSARANGLNANLWPPLCLILINMPAGSLLDISVSSMGVVPLNVAPRKQTNDYALFYAARSSVWKFEQSSLKRSFGTETARYEDGCQWREVPCVQQHGNFSRGINELPARSIPADHLVE